MEYTEDADRRELLLHSAYDSDTVRAMERPLLDKGVPLMRMAAQAAAHMAAGMLDDEDLALEDTSIVLLAGAGDNGGDGLFAAAALAQEARTSPPSPWAGRCMRPDSPHSCAPEARCWCLIPRLIFPVARPGFPPVRPASDCRPPSPWPGNRI